MKKLITNEIQFNDINYEKIDEDFDIFQVEYKGEGYLRQKEFLDLHFDFIKSISYLNGKNFYILCKKNSISSLDNIREKLIAEKDGDALTVSQVSAKEFNSFDYKATCKMALFNLFLNTLISNNEAYTFNNLTGTLIMLYKNSLSTIDKYGYFVALKVNLDYFEQTISLAATSYTKLSKFEDYKKYEPDKYRKIIKKPRYVIDSSNYILKRAGKNTEKEDVFVENQHKFNKQAWVDFINYDNYYDFLNNSKMGCIKQIYDLFHNLYSKYISFDFKKYDDGNVYEFQKDKSFLQFENSWISLIKEKGINVINLCEDSDVEAEEQIKTLILYFKQFLHNGKKADVAQGNVLNANKFNLVVCHDKDWYKKNKKVDPHKASSTEFITQHITLESINDVVNVATFKVNESSFRQIIGNILFNFVVKYDISQNKISKCTDSRIIELNNYSFIACSKEKYRPIKIFKLNILDNGKLYFEKLPCEGSNIEFYNLYNKLPDSIAIETFFIINDKGYINKITPSEKYLQPNFNDLVTELNKSNKNDVISGKDFKNWICNFKEKRTNDFNQYESFYNKLYDYVSDNDYIKDEINNLFITLNNKYGLLQPGQVRTCKKKLFNFIREEYGVCIINYLKNDESFRKYFPGFKGIKYVQVSDNVAFYTSGCRKTEKKKSIGRGVRIKNVTTVGDSKLFFHDILHTLDKGFVRYKQLTVYPYPFKYLHEYMLIDNERNKE